MEDDRTPKELVSFNKELIDLNFDDITVEELDRRLELALAQLPLMECQCPQLTSCGTYCNS